MLKEYCVVASAMYLAVTGRPRLQNPERAGHKSGELWLDFGVSSMILH